MKLSLQRFAPLVLGVLIGFDRWRFRGSKRMLCYPDGVMSFLSRHSILLKEFNKPNAKEMTDRLCAAIEKPATEAGIYRFLISSKISKEETALKIAKEHGTTEGLIAVLGCTEPCQNLRARKNRQTKKLEVRAEPGKCCMPSLVWASVVDSLVSPPFLLAICLPVVTAFAQKLRRHAVGGARGVG